MQYGGDSVLFKKRLKIYFTPNDLESDGKHESPHEYFDPRQTYHVERIVDNIGDKEQKYYELIGFRDRDGKITPKYQDDHEPILLYLPINDETKDGIIFDKTTELMKKYGRQLTEFHRKTKSAPWPKKSFVINDIFQHTLRPGYEVRPEMVTWEMYEYMTNTQSSFYLADDWRNNVNGYKILKTMIDYAEIKLNKDITFLNCEMKFRPKTLHVAITDEDNELNKMISELKSLIDSITDRTHPDVITFEHIVGWIRENIFVNQQKYHSIITRTLDPNAILQSGLKKKIETKYVYYNLSIETHIPKEIRKLYRLYQKYTKIFDFNDTVEQQIMTDDITRPAVISSEIQHHAGLIIVNNEHNTIYRFEPHGGIPTYYSFFTNFDEVINHVLTSLYVDHIVLHPTRTCPAMGTQRKFDLYNGACFFHTFYFECLLIFNPNVLTHEPGGIDFKYIHRYLSDNYTAKFINFYFTLYYLLSLDGNQYYSDQIYETVPLQKRLIDLRIINSILASGTTKKFVFYPFYDTLVNQMIELIKSDTMHHEHSDIYEFAVFKLAELNRHDEKNELISFIASIGYAKIIEFDPFTFLNNKSIICTDNTYVNIIVPIITQFQDVLKRYDAILIENPTARISDYGQVIKLMSIDPLTIIRLHRDKLLKQFEEKHILSVRQILSSYHFAILCDLDFYAMYENYTFYNPTKKENYNDVVAEYNTRERSESDEYNTIVNLDECVVETKTGEKMKVEDMFLPSTMKDSHRNRSVSGETIFPITLEDVYYQFMDYKNSAHDLWNTVKIGGFIPFELNTIKMFYHNINPVCFDRYLDKIAPYSSDSSIKIQFNVLIEFMTSNLTNIDHIFKHLLLHHPNIIFTQYIKYQVKHDHLYHKLYTKNTEIFIAAVQKFIASDLQIDSDKQIIIKILDKLKSHVVGVLRSNIDALLKSDAVVSLLGTSVPAVGGHMHAYNKFLKYNTKNKLLAKKIDHTINNMLD
jgi:hypothetical protein